GRRATAVLTGDLRRTLFLLALPVLAEQFLNSFVGFVDLFLSGHLSPDPTSELNQHATSAIGIAAYMGWLATMLFGFVGVGTTALVSRHWGANEHAEANRIANRSMALSLVMGVAVCLLFFLSAPWLAWFLEMEGARYKIAVRYLRIDAFGHIFSSLSLIGAAALRGTGNTRSPMLILGMVSVLNLIISPLLVFGLGPLPPLGIDGIVFGTVIARCSGGLLMVIALARGISGLKLLRTELTLRGEPVRRILRIGSVKGDNILSADKYIMVVLLVPLPFHQRVRDQLGNRCPAFGVHVRSSYCIYPVCRERPCVRDTQQSAILAAAIP
ncbi:MAG: polysaccharide biosynthesis C-terminal domain-containing protein, partial [Myxococcales bacterium]|nr:polysaccharide biosynthesis C-terminal domain-containing protein [Myxococcales bacterium]